MTLTIEEFQKRIGIQFNRPELLQQALTHRSYVNENTNKDGVPVEDNERLEYLGDAILDFVTADLLYSMYPEMTEGEMTRLRAALVRTEALAQIAEEYQLGQALLIGKGEANSGGRERINNLCAGFEAVVGAIYLDHGLKVVKDFIHPRLVELQEDVMEEAIHKDPRSQFQEWAQAVHSITPTYEVVSTMGPEHEKEFTVVVMLNEYKVAEGRGRSKRAAAQDAARIGLASIEDRHLDDLSRLPRPQAKPIQHATPPDFFL